MTLDEAIKHCLEVAEEQELFVNDKEMYSEMLGEDYKGFEEGCRECASEHRQLAEWLMEYKDLKAEQNDQCVFIHELMSEFKEAKQLLKLAMEDMKMLYESGRDEGCVGIEFKWRYADEALKLIGEELSGS